MSEEIGSTRTAVRRHADRGHYDRATIHTILDEGLVGHLGFAVEGQPYVIPTLYARIDDTLYLHGAVANRMLGAMADGVAVCLTVTLLDGLVLARSHYSHSANYRSVVVLGTARDVVDRAEKVRSFEALVEHVARGRWHDARQPTEPEIRSTRVLALPIDEASAKIRSGPPKDDPEDLELEVWAGVVPLALVAGAPVPAPDLRNGRAVPAYVANYRRGTA